MFDTVAGSKYIITNNLDTSDGYSCFIGSYFSVKFKNVQILRDLFQLRINFLQIGRTWICIAMIKQINVCSVLCNTLAKRVADKTMATYFCVLCDQLHIFFIYCKIHTCLMMYPIICCIHGMTSGNIKDPVHFCHLETSWSKRLIGVGTINRKMIQLIPVIIIFDNTNNLFFIRFFRIALATNNKTGIFSSEITTIDWKGKRHLCN